MTAILLPLVIFPALLTIPACMPPPYASARVQQSTGSAPPGEASNLAAAAPELQSLIRAMSGRWVIDVKFEPSAEVPNGAKGTGEELWKPLASGLVFSDEERIEMEQGTVHLLGLIWWDRVDKGFRGMQCIDQDPHACNVKSALQDVSIKWDGKQLTIEEAQTSRDGKKALWHETFSEITPSSFLQVGESWYPDGRHTKVVTVHGSRKSE